MYNLPFIIFWFQYTPLHGASGYGHEEIVKILVLNGADINETTYSKVRVFWKICEIE